MAKIKCIIVLLLTVYGNIESQELGGLSQMSNSSLFDYNYHDRIERDLNLSLKIIFPPPNKFSSSFICIGTGIGLGIIQEHYYIGIAGDLALGSDLVRLLFSDDKDTGDSTQFGFSLGFRIYNLINYSRFTIIPFLGCDLIYVILPMPYTGIELMYKIFGIEYAYYFPFNSVSRHQISIKFHMPKN